MAIPPINTSNATTPFSALESPLYRAVAHSIRDQVHKEGFPATTSAPFAIQKPHNEKTASPQFNTDDIINLLNKLNPRGVRFSELKGISTAHLQPEEREIYNFLLKNEKLFKFYAKLDGIDDFLSPKDIEAARRLNENGKLLNTERFARTNETNMTDNTAATLPAAEKTTLPQREIVPGNQQTAASPMQDEEEIEQAVQLFEKIAPQGIPLDQFQNLNLQSTLPTADPNSTAFRFLENLQSEHWKTTLTELARIHGNVLNRDMILSLANMMWNPAIAYQAPLLFFKDFSLTPKLGPVEKISEAPSPDKQQMFHIEPQDDSHLEVEISGQELLALCKKISANGKVTLQAFRDYKAESEEELRLLRYLYQLHVFKSLAEMDGSDGTVSLDDIKIAVTEHALIFVDPYLSLMIVP